jgi:hypothetical protein
MSVAGDYAKKKQRRYFVSLVQGGVFSFPAERSMIEG